MLKPLIKYTGGKFKEYDKFKEYLPQTINDYYELFAGGAGVCWRLLNDDKINGQVILNDKSFDLTTFYQSVNDEHFKDELYKIASAWNTVKEFGQAFYKAYDQRFNDFIHYDIDEDFVTEDIIEYINKLNVDYNFHNYSIHKEIIKEINNKAKRFSKKDIAEGDNVSEVALTTCICQAFYFVIRNMYNDWNNHGKKDEYNVLEMSAHWFFIREFCFCSMFRVGKNGDFNVPYGGFTYNNKDFEKKIENIISEETRNAFKSIIIKNEDFEEILKSDLNEDDFIFLDPPYDSTFNEYDNNTFSHKDQERLAEMLKQCKCKWLLSIGKTDFITNLYKDYSIIEYDKTYMYQARGTYDNKHTTHLVIKNY